jgi:oxalate decarboxylase
VAALKITSATSLNTPVYKDISLANWMALTPKELVRGHLNLDADVLKALRRERDAVVRGGPSL